MMTIITLLRSPYIRPCHCFSFLLDRAVGWHRHQQSARSQSTLALPLRFGNAWDRGHSCSPVTVTAAASLACRARIATRTAVLQDVDQRIRTQADPGKGPRGHEVSRYASTLHFLRFHFWSTRVRQANGARRSLSSVVTWRFVIGILHVWRCHRSLTRLVRPLRHCPVSTFSSTLRSGSRRSLAFPWFILHISRSAFVCPEVLPSPYSPHRPPPHGKQLSASKSTAKIGTLKYEKSIFGGARRR